MSHPFEVKAPTLTCFSLRTLTSLALIVCLLMLDVPVYAFNPLPQAEEPQGGEPSFSSPVPIQIPENLGSMELFHRGSSGKTLIYIQDAHDSLQAQENISRLIHHLVETQKVKTVFEEGYEGQVPTDEFFGSIEENGIRERTAFFFMDRLRISGAEYAHITRTRDFDLIGADDEGLHLENIAWYRQAAEAGAGIAGDLSVIRKHIRNLSNRYLPREFKRWLKEEERFQSGELDLAGYLRRLLKLGKKNVPDPEEFARMYPMIHLLLSNGYEEGGQRTTQDTARRLFQEIEAFESSLVHSSLSSQRDRQIFYYDRLLKLVERLNALKMTQQEYERVKEKLHAFDALDLAAFIGENTERPLILSRQWEHSIQAALKFYETAERRDQAVRKRIGKFLETEETTAVLVFGGFHRANIQAILEEEGVSFLIVSPRIEAVSERHMRYYKQLMAVGHYPFEVPPVAAIATATQKLWSMNDGRTLPGRELVALAERSIREQRGFMDPAEWGDLVARHLKAEVEREGRSELRAGASQEFLFTELSSPEALRRSEAWQRLKRWRQRGIAVLKEIRIEQLDDPDVFSDFTFVPAGGYEKTVSSILLNGIQLFFRRRADGHIFMDPMPGRKYLSRIYGPGYEKAEDGEGLMGYPDYFSNTPFKFKRARDLAEQIEKRTDFEQLRVLEVGPGDGHNLIVGRDDFGWEVTASETVPVFVEAMEQAGIPVFEEWFEETDFGSEKYEAVIMRDVLEHMTDPALALRKTAALTVDNGLLYIKLPVSPDTGPTYGYLQHLHHFSEQSIESLLRQSGFVIEEIIHHSNPAQPGLPAMDHMDIYARRNYEIPVRSELRTMSGRKKYSAGELAAYAAGVRKKVMEMWIAKKGPLSGAFSMADLYTVFFMNFFDAEAYRSGDPARLRFSPKGTAAYTLYAAAAYAGLIDPAPMEAGDYSAYDPVPYGDMFGDISIYKMGMQVDQGIGMALAGKVSGLDYPVVVFTADGEFQTGLAHQAKFAARQKLDNLAVVVDVNMLQSSYQISDVDPNFDPESADPLSGVRKEWQAYGWDVMEIDGHDYKAIEAAYARIGSGEKPLVILARTLKGKGVPFMEGSLEYNHRVAEPAQKAEALRILTENLQNFLDAGYNVDFPDFPAEGGVPPVETFRAFETPRIPVNPGQLIETTFRDWIDELIRRNENRIVVLNTDNPKPWGKDTPIRTPVQQSPQIFAGINERFALNLAAGLSRAGYTPFYAGPAAHMPVLGEDWKFMALEGLGVTVVSLAPGSELSSWGPAHLAYEDIRTFTTKGAVVYQPATAYDLAALLHGLYGGKPLENPVYLRIPEMTGPDAGRDRYESGELEKRILEDGFYVIDSYAGSPAQEVKNVIVTSGATTKEALRAGELLKKAGVSFKIINVVNLSELNAASFREEVGESAWILTAIDALPESLSALAAAAVEGTGHRMMARGIADGGRYGSPQAVFAHYGLDAAGIANTVLEQSGFPSIQGSGETAAMALLLEEALLQVDDLHRLNRKFDLGLSMDAGALDEDTADFSVEAWDKILRENWYWSALSPEEKRVVIEERIRPLAAKVPLIRSLMEKNIREYLGPEVPVEIISYRVNGSSVYGRFREDHAGDLDGVAVIRAPGIRDVVPVPEPVEIIDGMLFDSIAVVSEDLLDSNHPFVLEALTGTYGGGIPVIGPRVLRGSLSERNRLLQARHNFIHGWISLQESEPVYRKWDIRAAEADSILHQLGLIEDYDPMAHWRRVDQVKRWTDAVKAGGAEAARAKESLQSFVAQADIDYEAGLQVIAKRLEELRRIERQDLLRSLLQAGDEQAQRTLLLRRVEAFRKARQEQSHVPADSLHFFGGWVGMFLDAKNPDVSRQRHLELIATGDSTLILRIAHASRDPETLKAVFEASQYVLEDGMRRGILYQLSVNPAVRSELRNALAVSALADMNKPIETIETELREQTGSADTPARLLLSHAGEDALYFLDPQYVTVIWPSGQTPEYLIHEPAYGRFGKMVDFPHVSAWQMPNTPALQIAAELAAGYQEDVLSEFLGFGPFPKTGEEYRLALGTLLAHPSERVASAAAWIAGELQLENLVPGLVSLVESRRPEPSVAAAIALAKMPVASPDVKHAVQQAFDRTDDDSLRYQLGIALKKMPRDRPYRRAANLVAPSPEQSGAILEDALFHGYVTLLDSRGSVVRDWREIRRIVQGTEMLVSIPHYLNTDSLLKIVPEALRGMREYLSEQKTGFLISAHLMAGNGKQDILARARRELLTHPQNPNHYVLYVFTGLKFDQEVPKPADRIIRGKGRNERLSFELANYASPSLRGMVQFDDDEVRFRGEWIGEMAAPLLEGKDEERPDMIYPIQSRHWDGGRSTNSLQAPFIMLRGYAVRSPQGGAYGFSPYFLQRMMNFEWNEDLYNWHLNPEFGAVVTRERLKVAQVAVGYKDHGSFASRLSHEVFSRADNIYDFITAGFDTVSDQIDLWRHLSEADTVIPAERRNLPLPAPHLIEYDVANRLRIYRDAFHAGFSGDTVHDGLTGNERLRIFKLVLTPEAYEAVESTVKTGELAITNELWYEILVGMLSTYHALKEEAARTRVADVMRPLFTARLHYRMKLIDDEKQRLQAAGILVPEIEERLNEISEENVYDLMARFGRSRAAVARRMTELKADTARRAEILKILSGASGRSELRSPLPDFPDDEELNTIAGEVLKPRFASGEFVRDPETYPQMPEEWQWSRLTSFHRKDYHTYLNYVLRDRTEAEREQAGRVLDRALGLEILSGRTVNDVDAFVLRLIRRISAQADGLAPLKQIWHRSAVDALPGLWRSVESEPDDESRLRRALAIALSGNRLGFRKFLEAARPDFQPDFEGFMKMSVPLDPVRVAEVLYSLRGQGTRSILYVTDNAGEDVADLILIRLLLEWGHSVTIAAHESESANDTTVSDVRGLLQRGVVRELFRSDSFEMPDVISSGADARRGTDLRFASQDLAAAWREGKNPLLFSKGDSNHYLLSGITADVIHLRMIKSSEGNTPDNREGDAIIDVEAARFPEAARVHAVLKGLHLAARGVTKGEAAVLQSALLKNPIARETWGVNEANAGQVLQERLEVFEKTHDALASWWASNHGGQLPWEKVWNIWIPEALEIVAAKQRKRPGEAYIYGIAGHGGAGKTTHAGVLQTLLTGILPSSWGSVEVISTDDFYLPQKEREALRATGLDLGPGIPNRGLPGHHDTEAMARFLDQVRKSGPESLILAPVFSKGLDERLEKPREIRGRVGILIFEGWFVGAGTNVDPSAIPPGEILARRVAESLPAYAPSFEAVDDLVSYKAPDTDTAVKNRIEQEELRRRLEPDKPGMTDAQLEKYVRMVYEKGWSSNVTSPVPPDSRVTFFAAADEKHHMIQWSRSDLRRESSGINYRKILNYPRDVIFSIRAADLERLESSEEIGKISEWRELLILAAANRKKVRILIRDADGYRGSARIDELKGFGSVYFRPDHPDLKIEGVRTIYFSPLKEPYYPALEKNDAHFALYAGSFGTALLYDLHEGQLPGLQMQNEKWYDPYGIHAAEVLSELSAAYIAVSRAA